MSGGQPTEPSPWPSPQFSLRRLLTVCTLCALFAAIARFGFAAALFAVVFGGLALVVARAGLSLIVGRWTHTAGSEVGDMILGGTLLVVAIVAAGVSALAAGMLISVALSGPR